MSVIQELKRLKRINPYLLLPGNRIKLCSELRAKGYAVFEDSIRKMAKDVLENNEVENKIYRAKESGMWSEEQLAKLRNG